VTTWLSGSDSASGFGQPNERMLTLHSARVISANFNTFIVISPVPLCYYRLVVGYKALLTNSMAGNC
jgi:hypothetical protein